MFQKSTQVHNVSADELTQAIIKGVEERISVLELKLQNKQSSEYLNRKQVASLLGVSLVTINEWCKKGILKPYKIGNRVRFKREEVIATLEKPRA